MDNIRVVSLILDETQGFKEELLFWTEGGDEVAIKRCQLHFENEEDLEIGGYTINKLLPNGEFEPTEIFLVEPLTGKIEWYKEKLDST